jgi:hypothetical protein
VYSVVGGRVVVLKEGRNENGEPVEGLSIANTHDMKPVEGFNDEVFEDEPPRVHGYQSYWQFMSDLRQTAHRQAIGADDAFNDVLDALDDEPPYACVA